MLNMKILQQLTLLIVLSVLFNAAICQNDDDDDNDDNDEYDENNNEERSLEPISKMIHSEITNKVVNKSIVLEIYSKDESKDDSSEEEDDSDSEEDENEDKGKLSLVGKLTVLISTKILKDGKQIGPVVVENETLYFDEDEISDISQETNSAEDEDEGIDSSEKVDNATESNITSSDDKSKEKPNIHKLTPIRVTEESMDEEETTTTTTRPTTTESSIFSFIYELPFLSSAVCIYSSILNKLLLAFTLYIAFIYK